MLCATEVTIIGLLFLQCAYLQTVDDSNDRAEESWPSHAAKQCDQCEHQEVVRPWTTVVCVLSYAKGLRR